VHTQTTSISVEEQVIYVFIDGASMETQQDKLSHGHLYFSF